MLANIFLTAESATLVAHYMHQLVLRSRRHISDPSLKVVGAVCAFQLPTREGFWQLAAQ
jgi:Na+-translocating ferredoxin:NAD+ oxidoreductase RnfD subunit